MTRRRRRSTVLQVAGAVLLSLVGCAPTVGPVDPGIDVDVPVDFALATDFPDPDLLRVDDGWLAYATQSDSAHVQVASSSDLRKWALLDEDAFPDLPSWAREGDTWSPEVTRWQGRYLLFHTSTDDATGVQCIGVAVATDPLGPFRESAAEPLVCPDDGAIDSSFFVDDGRPYLLWKEDGNCCGGTGRIMLSELTGDALQVAGEAVEILGTSQLWEGDVVEAPTLIRRPDGYVLFYSGGDYSTLDYGIGWARADFLTGPYVASEQPLLSTEGSDFAYIGPGGQDIVDDLVFFHSWGAGHDYRGLHFAPLAWDAGVPRIELPRSPD